MNTRIGFGALGNCPDEIVELARRAEQMGYERSSFGDHLAQPVDREPLRAPRE